MGEAPPPLAVMAVPMRPRGKAAAVTQQQDAGAVAAVPQVPQTATRGCLTGTGLPGARAAALLDRAGPGQRPNGAGPDGMSLPGRRPALLALAGRCPGWEAWAGVTGTLYARRLLSSPPVVVQAADADGLAAQIVAAEGRHAATGSYFPRPQDAPG